MGNPIDGYPVVIEIPVVWGEMNAFQQVNNVVYFRYFEIARIVYLEILDVLDLMNRTRLLSAKFSIAQRGVSFFINTT